jgi:hypothetical protein
MGPKKAIQEQIRDVLFANIRKYGVDQKEQSARTIGSPEAFPARILPYGHKL